MVIQVQNTIGYQNKSAKPYDVSLEPSFPSYSRSVPVQTLLATIDRVSVKSPLFPRNKPENSYSVLKTRYDDGNAIEYLDVPYREHPYDVSQISSSSFAALNPTASLLYKFSSQHLVPDNELLMKLRSRVLASKVNIPVLLAESKKTVQMVLQSAKRLATAYRQVRQGNLGAAASTLGVRPIRDRGKGSGNNWLEYKYGWMPLLSDVYGAAEHLARRELNTSYTQKVTVSILKRNESFIPNLSVGGSVGFAVPFDIRGRVTSSSKATVVYYTTNALLRERSQLGFTDPLLVAWELVPLSFVVDWFIPIGNYLEQFNSFKGLEVRKCFINRRTLLQLDGKAKAPGRGISRESEFRFDRTVNVNPAVTFPSFNIPDHNVTSKIITSLALFRQRL